MTEAVWALFGNLIATEKVKCVNDRSFKFNWTAEYDRIVDGH